MKNFGFGLMRLPQGENGADLEQVKKMVDRFIEAGGTYFDTAYVYEGAEVAFRESVAKRYPRESYTIANKLPAWMLNKPEDLPRIFNESLERCGVEYFDYYLIHAVQPTRMPNIDGFDCWNFCLKLKEEGKIKKFGFSFHGDPELLEKVLTDHPEVEFVQLQLNYLDMESGIIHGREIHEICCRHNKPIVVMEPVKGGILAKLPQDAEKALREVNTEDSPAAFALRYAASLKNVFMVLSGMSNQAQTDENVSVFEHYKPLSQEEFAASDKMREIILGSPAIGCTSCRYCVDGCPMKINIPEVFRCYNDLLLFGEHMRPHFYYNNMILLGDTARASECIECGACEAACPQHLPIIESLKKASELLDK